MCWIASANILHLEKRTTQYHDTCNVVPRTGTQKSEHGAVIHAPRVHPPHVLYLLTDFNFGRCVYQTLTRS